MITGPTGTPYENGLFEFEVTFGPNYPTTPPVVRFLTTGNGRFRFNPNLYSNGKVCLSLLNTFPGAQDEMWNQNSTLLQALISIQGLIFTSEPYFNEPGLESARGTRSGDFQSAVYSTDIRMGKFQHAIMGQLQNGSPCFKDVIQSHLFLKKDDILLECNEPLPPFPLSQVMQKKYEDQTSRVKEMFATIAVPPRLL